MHNTFISLFLIANIYLNPYLANIFGPENVVCLLRVLHIIKCTTEFFAMKANNMNPIRRSSLFWVHIVYIIGGYQSMLADERTEDN